MTMSMKTAVFSDVMPYSMVNVDKCSRGAYYLHHQCDEILVNTYQTTCSNMNTNITFGDYSTAISVNKIKPNYMWHNREDHNLNKLR
jgi:hypothetical protein